MGYGSLGRCGMRSRASQGSRIAAPLLLIAILGVAAGACTGGPPTPPSHPTPTASRLTRIVPAACSARPAPAGIHKAGSTPWSGHGGRPSVAAPPGVGATPGGSIIYALLADNRLLAIRAGDGAVVAEHPLATAPAPATDAGRYLALSPDGAHLVVLTLGAPEQGQRIVLIDAATGSLRATHSLTVAGVVFRGLAVGPRTGQVYLFGGRQEGAEAYPLPAGPPRFCSPARSVIVAVLDPRSGVAHATWTVRESAGYDWQVYQGSVTDDERALFVSYHGPDTDGLDRFEMTDHGPRRCPVVAPLNRGCYRAHGGFLPFGDGILVATGTQAILEIGSEQDGTIRRGFDTGLTNNHLMEFAVDRQAGQLYAVGSCGYGSGFSVVDLGAGKAATAAVMGQPGLCGARLALGAEGTLVLGQAAQAVPQAGVVGAVVILDRRDGQVLRVVATPAEPVDVLATGVP